MAFVNQVLADGARMVVRQALSTPVSSGSPVTSSTIPLSTPFPSTASSVISTTSPAPSSTETASNGSPGSPPGSGQQQSQNSSPLLFFVALGFGVVFTNLWIIVGVKYCFRYNARNRAMRLNEDGEPINLENMPRPHRRRREKKLMTMDEVNEKFPMQKYKNWVASRVQEGLPTQGGVTAPSRPNSIRDADGIVPEIPSKERDSTEERPMTSGTSNAQPETKVAEEVKPAEAGHKAKESTSSTVAPAAISTDPEVPATVSEEDKTQQQPLSKARESQDDEDEEDDEHINAALPPECMGTSGDTCAICIDTLEDDDDVRGLTCGHAFHAVCLDPWLTSRRACCPLCKADYYTPKPRPEGAAGTNGSPTVIAVDPATGTARSMNMPNRPGPSWIGMRSHRGMMMPGRMMIVSSGPQYEVERSPTRGGSGFGLFSRNRRQAAMQATGSPTTQTVEAAAPAPTRSRFAGLRSALPFPSRLGRRENAQPTTEPPVAAGAIAVDVTPSNLEAGVRPVETR